MSSSVAAELGAAEDAVAGYRRRVRELVGGAIDPAREDLIAAIDEAERGLRSCERLLRRARELAES